MNAKGKTGTKLSLKEIASIEKGRINAELGRRSLRNFVKAAWRIVENDEYVGNWHIDVICDHLEAVYRGDLTRLVINIPPRMSKSLIVSVFWPTWIWTKDPGHKFIFASYNEKLATRDSVTCRRLITSPWYMDNYWSDPDVELTDDSNLKTKYQNTALGYRNSSSLRQGITGDGADTVVLDDPHDVRKGESDVDREAIKDIFDSVLPSRLNNQETGRKVIVMQRVHDGDLSGHILDPLRDLGYEHLKIPMEYDGKHRSTIIMPDGYDPRTLDGELLCPNRVSADAARKLRQEMGPYNYAGQYQQNPSPPDGGLIKREWLNNYWRELPTNFDEMLQVWDLTFGSKGKTASWSVGQVWGRVGSKRYLVDQYRAKVEFQDQVGAIRAMVSKYPQAGVWIENKALGEAAIDMLSNHGISAARLKPNGQDKMARMSPAIPTFAAGDVIFPDPAINSWSGDLIERLCRFPRGENDEGDCIAYAMQKMNVANDFFFAVVDTNSGDLITDPKDLKNIMVM